MHLLKICLLGVVLTTSAFAAARAASTKGEATSAENYQSLAMNLIYQRTLPSIVSITVRDHNDKLRRSSGFFVNKSGLFATGFSDVENAQRIVIRTHDGWLHEVSEVIALSREHDLALLRAPLTDTQPLALISPTTNLTTGYPAIAIGSSQGLSWKVTQAVVDKRAEMPPGQTQKIPLRHKSNRAPRAGRL